MDITTSRKVLVADSTRVGRQLATFLFGNRGHGVHAVGTADDFFARLDATLDLVVVHLPLNDVEPAVIAREVRRLAPQATLIALAFDPADGFDQTHAPPLEPALVDQLFGSPKSGYVDVPRLMKMVDQNRDLLRKLVDILEPTVASILNGLNAAIADVDAAAVAGLGHRLKGTFGNVAASEAVAAALKLEQIGKSGDLSEVDAAMETMASAAKHTIAELRAILAK